jgi:hypothetical protein
MYYRGRQATDPRHAAGRFAIWRMPRPRDRERAVGDYVNGVGPVGRLPFWSHRSTAGPEWRQYVTRASFKFDACGCLAVPPRRRVVDSARKTTAS